MTHSESFLIDVICHQKKGDREFMLWCIGDDAPEPWIAAIGNKDPNVTLVDSLAKGIDGVDFLASGESAQEALERLLAAMNAGE